MTTTPPKCKFCDKPGTLETLRNDGSGNVLFVACQDCTVTFWDRFHAQTGQPVFVQLDEGVKRVL